MDIVYTLADKYGGDELKYSLRSLVNLPHDQVFIVGGCPRWIQNVVHIRTEQNGTKWENSLNNIRTACKDERLSANFILMNDDFFILEPIRTPTKELNIYNDTLSAQVSKLQQRQSPPGNYIRGLIGTSGFIKGLGITDPLSYELHTPFVFNKKKLQQTFDLEGANQVKFLQIRSLYGNLHLKGSTPQKDVKVFLRQGFVPKNVGKFLSCDNGGFSILHNSLSCKFPNKSIYEV